ncbi:hypothetical protein O181_088498 [Austropuccinia psidii MF-1]|uniref:ATP-dependent DNA helicase n=1 Tax=Austropuccinia psidii MF-1 TaxID=1389203 RepID=A0A9Q3IRL1_9BASI|nr:hypothetical protein [Austropuccinia psidii MF-1]
MLQLYQDAMALVKIYGKPSLFITMTANPRWLEINECLVGNQLPSDRPNIISRVFKMKLDTLIQDLTINKGLGTVKSYVYTIEFQKRGLPHAHIILILAKNSIPDTIPQIDTLVCAEIPHPIQEKKLYELVTTKMLHSPCKEGSRCWTKFGWISFENRGYTYTNKDVIPYNKYLLLRNECHINVEIPYGIKALKYLYKYICKGEDRSALNLELEDETLAFVIGRYVGPSEATWRLFQFHLSDREPSIQRLSIHLEDQQLVFFQDEEGAIRQMMTGAANRTTLTEFFCLNRQDAIGKGVRARNLLYHEIPQFFYWDKQKKKWLGRVKSAGSVGRIFFARIDEGERYFMRLLLLHRHNIQCFSDLRIVNGFLHQTFREAADPPSNPTKLLQDNFEILSHDCKHKLQVARIIPQPSAKDISDYCLFLLHEELSLHNTNLTQAGINLQVLDPERFTVGTEARRPSWKMCEAYDYNVLTSQKSKVFNEFTNAMSSSLQYLGFVDGPGGSGKTYLINCILKQCKNMGKKAYAVCASGIEALLLIDGMTAHSAFAIPLTLCEDSTCNWFPTNSQAKKLRELEVIIWDEISMQHRYGIEAVDRSLRDLNRCDKPFGGISVLFSGDFRQILPIVKHGGIYDQAAACIKCSYIWECLRKNSLKGNLRLDIKDGGNTNDVNDFAGWLQRVGEGSLQESDISTLDVSSLNHFFNEKPQVVVERVIAFVYGDVGRIMSNGSSEDVAEYLEDRGIVTPLNMSVHDINTNLLQKIKQPKFISRSIDSVIEHSQNNVPEEVLNAIQVPGFPLHVLELKVKIPVILLRNLNISKGLCNGTRLMIEDIKPHVLKCLILTGPRKRKSVLIPKIKFHHEETDEHAISFSRYQFPVSLSFAITINKAQGQSFKYVGVYLNTSVFAHGQLYVALSRAQSKLRLFVGVSGDSQEHRVTNVVVRNIIH